MKLTKKAIIFLILSLIMLFSSVFAWMNLSRIGDIDGIDSNIADYSNLTTFYVKRKGETAYTSIITINDMQSVFGDTRPGETYEFRVEFENITGSERSFIVELKDVLTNFRTPESVDFDLRDVFYIDEGKVNVSYYDAATNEFVESLPPFYLDIVSDDEVIKHDQVLNDYRLNNLIGSNNNLVVSNVVNVLHNYTVVVTFILAYDETTKNILYQENELKFSGIYIYGQ